MKKTFKEWEQQFRLNIQFRGTPPVSPDTILTKHEFLNIAIQNHALAS